MKTNPALRTFALVALLLSTLNPQPSTVFAQGTAFTYQGRLNDGGAPANGNYDLRFTLYDALSSGAVVAGPLTNAPTAVSNGLFTVTLNFGAGAFPGADRWLEIGVRSNGVAAFTTVSPRQQLTPAPYAITAGNVVSNGLAAGTYGNAVTLNNPANNFTGNGGGLTNVNALTLGGVGSNGFWRTTGNAGTTPGSNFLGTTDNQPLELNVNGLRALRIEPNDSVAPNLIGGSPRNFVAAGVVGATIAGGGAANYFLVSYTNSVLADFGAIGGGFYNTIQLAAYSSTIGGGFGNTIQTNAGNSTIGGGQNNTIQLNADGSTIGGGFSSTIQPSADGSTIGGGDSNTIRTNADHSTIGGGLRNTIQTNASYSTIGGGYFNTNFGRYATVPGGDQNVAGTNSFAAGHRAKANHTGVFAWADSTDADFASTGANQFLIRASGGVGIGTTAPEADLHVFRGSAGNVTANATAPLVVESDGNAFVNILSPSSTVSGVLFGSPIDPIDASVRYNNSGANRELSFRTLNSQRMVITTNGFVGIGTGSPTNTLQVNGGVSATAFVNTSDRNAKENFAPVSPLDVLNKVAALPITTWNFKTMNDGRHMGPMAQDFYAAFGLGGGDTTITSIDPDGVALAAIQGLNQKLEATCAKNADLRQRLERLERLLDKETSAAR